MPEPSQVLGNRSGAAQARKWMQPPQQGQVMKTFGPVALRLQHLDDADCGACAIPAAKGARVIVSCPPRRAS